ncbi:hypothetical protein MTO96_028716 [Rhipicephalus appendiculatus]
MTSADLDSLCSHLSRMKAYQLYSLEDERSLTIPPIWGLPLPRAVASIRRHVGAINDITSRVHYMCEIYACLMKKGVIGPWVLYQVGDTQRVPEAADVIRYIKETVLNCFFTRLEKVTTERTRIYSVVQEVELEINSPRRGLEIYCFCIWPSLACVAVLRPTEGYSAGQKEVLEKMFGDNAEAFECGMYEDLDLAHQAATNLASAEDAKASKKDAEASKKDAEASKKDAEASKKDAEASMKDAKPSKKDAKPSKKDAKPSKKDAKPSKKDAKPSKKDLKASTENGHASTENGHASTENGHASTENGHASTENGEASTEGAEEC